MPERRYTDDEIAAIFARAAEQQSAALPERRDGGADTGLTAGAGMTLAELQEIGREVGIPAELVTRAATSLDRGGRPSERRFLALPIGVGRTVSLGRRLSDAEWERLVVDLRETFDARGRVRDDGAFKQWTNGNLQALVEPTPDGHRVRLRTMNGSASALMNMGLSAAGIAGVLELLHAVGVVAGASGPSVALLAVMGVASFVLGAVRLPSWARLRRRQMEEVAERLTAAAPPDAASGTPPDRPPDRS